MGQRGRDTQKEALGPQSGVTASGSPRQLVKVLSRSVRDPFALVAVAQLGRHQRWERKKKRAEEGTGLQADPLPSTETMPQSLREDSKATESSLCA